MCNICKKGFTQSCRLRKHAIIQRIKCMYVEYVARHLHSLVSLKKKRFLSHEGKQPFVCVVRSQACSKDITTSIQGKSYTSVRLVARLSQDLVVSRNITRFTQGRNHLWVMPVARSSLNLVTSQSIIALTRRKRHTFVEFVTNGSHLLTV
jgi:hypothetical protein